MNQLRNQNIIKYVIPTMLRSLIVNTAVIRILPVVFGSGIWFTFGIYEAVVLVIAVFLVRRAERVRIAK